jgi:aspartate dehydrogenase
VLTVTGPAAFFAVQPAGQGYPVSLASLAGPTQVFRGTGADALQALPELANAIAVLCYAGRGFGETTVIAVADPAARDLTCVVAASAGDFTVTAETRIPLPSQGLQASPLVALSAVTALRRAAESLVIG